MCGIFCAASEHNDVACHLHSELEQLLHNRGPDVQDKLIIENNNVLLAGNVLWQQGEAPQKQPIAVDQLVLLFNGDLYNLKQQKDDNQADSAWLMQQLIKCEQDDDKICKLLHQLQGPYCLILYNRLHNVLYFCRDALGRNSLIIERQTQCLKLMSTSCHLPHVLQEPTEIMELPPLGLYKLQLSKLNTCVLYPWQLLQELQQQQLQQMDAAMRWQTMVASPIAPAWLLNETLEASSYDFYSLVDETVELNELYTHLLHNQSLKQTLHTLHKLLQRSVAARVLHTAPVCRNCQGCGKCKHAKICILFSGGIDCSILALLAHQFVPQTEPIELINVAFERTTTTTTTEEEANIWNVPDRLTAQQSHAELQQLCPARDWQLLEVNVTRAELKQQLSAHICQLIYPLQTVLDESLGCAFWFAASTCKSAARVALLGSGADELFGGYQRHRNAYRRAPVGNKLDSLRQELELDWQRIPARNLARDDRIIADTGKTARAPFIEEHVASFVRSLQPQQRCCYALSEGVGDKLLLRLYGFSLGLRDAVLLKKRAIQFGSRIADKKQQATQQSEYLRFDNIVNPCT